MSEIDLSKFISSSTTYIQTPEQKEGEKENGQELKAIIYLAHGVISQEWQGSDVYGHWQTVGLDLKGNDIIREAYEKFNQGRDVADYRDPKVRVTIELIED